MASAPDEEEELEPTDDIASDEDDDAAVTYLPAQRQKKCGWNVLPVPSGAKQIVQGYPNVPRGLFVICVNEKII